jgi:hypothetical protein
VTTDEAIANAARILEGAESVLDLALMDRLIALADSWLLLAARIIEREHAG